MRFLLAMTFFVMVNLILTYGLYDVIKPSAYVYPSLQWTVYLTVLIPLNILIFYLSLRIYNISDIKFKKNLFTITYDIIIKKPVLFVELLLYPLILWVLAELILYPLIKFTIYNFWPSIIPLSATLPIQFIYITFHIFVLNEVVKLMLLLTIMIVTFFTILICLKMFSRFTRHITGNKLTILDKIYSYKFWKWMLLYGTIFGIFYFVIYSNNMPNSTMFTLAILYQFYFHYL